MSSKQLTRKDYIIGTFEDISNEDFLKALKDKILSDKRFWEANSKGGWSSKKLN